MQCGNKIVLVQSPVMNVERLLLTILDVAITSQCYAYLYNNMERNDALGNFF